MRAISRNRCINGRCVVRYSVTCSYVSLLLSIVRDIHRVTLAPKSLTLRKTRKAVLGLKAATP